MPLAIETDSPPLRVDDHGTVRIGTTRVTLDTVIGCYLDGATPEQIVLQFSSLALADVYAVIGYYLRHVGQVDAYLAQRRREADDLRGKIESNPDMQRIRRQLLERRKASTEGAAVIRFLADENFNGIIIRGLLRRQPFLDLVTAREVGLAGADDPTLLLWAANQLRVTLTHDARTLAGFAYDRVDQGMPMSGVIEVATTLPIGPVIDDLLLIAEASFQEEWAGQVIYLPL